jgi:hypothetical protein
MCPLTPITNTLHIKNMIWQTISSFNHIIH